MGSLVKWLVAYYIILITSSLVTGLTTGPYSDVLVVINVNSTDSIDIGEYYASLRNITHVLYLNIPDWEDDYGSSYPGTNYTEYISYIENPIKEYMIDKDITYTTNYIVLTYGIPYKGDCEGEYFSIGQQLELINGNYEGSYGCQGTPGFRSVSSLNNPYYNNPQHADKIETEIYIVSYLIGATANETKNSIPISYNNSWSGDSILIDNYPGSLDSTGNFNSTRTLANQYSSLYGYTVEYNDTGCFIFNRSNLTFVTNYANWEASHMSEYNCSAFNTLYLMGNSGANSSNYNHYFVPGSICNFFTSWPYIEFHYPEYQGNTEPQYAGYIKNGCSFGIGGVTEPFSGNVPKPTYLLNATLKNYSYGEAGVSSLYSLGWVESKFGDPKLAINPIYNDTPASINKTKCIMNHPDTQIICKTNGNCIYVSRTYFNDCDLIGTPMTNTQYTCTSAGCT